MLPLTSTLSPTTAEVLRRNSEIDFSLSTQEQAMMSSRFSITVVVMFTRLGKFLFFISYYR